VHEQQDEKSERGHHARRPTALSGLAPGIRYGRASRRHLTEREVRSPPLSTKYVIAECHERLPVDAPEEPLTFDNRALRKLVTQNARR